MGSNMAECHPVAFRFVMQAKTRKDRPAILIHVDPRFTRTSAMADYHVPIRAGSDIVFLGALINYIIQNERYFKDYVVKYTNAATLLRDDYQDAEDLDGLFSGWSDKDKTYNVDSWAYASGSGDHPQATPPPQGTQPGQRLTPPTNVAPPWAPKDETLQDPKCVFQVMKRHYARYTPEMVEQVCGCPKDLFLKVADEFTKRSGRDMTGAFCYAVGWTQHTTGVQMIRAAGMVQALLGNMGRPGGGVLALRGHATIQGSTDIPTLYHSLPGYLSQPSITRPHDNLASYLNVETKQTGWWFNTPKYMVSLLKAYFGDAATKDNDYLYDLIPKTSGDHSHIPMFIDMGKGNIRGFFAMGQNPAVGGQNARMQRRALAQLDFLVVRDIFETETASFWKDSPEVLNGELKPQDIKTEVFFLPAAGAPEKDGSFTNTQRLIQWHEKAAEPPGDARSELWFMHQLMKRLKAMYQGSTNPNDRAIQSITMQYGVRGTGNDEEPLAADIMKEVHGWTVADKKLVAGFADLKDDGSTASGCWIYSGVYTQDGVNKAQNRKADAPGTLGSHQGWGFAWPANRRILYNRASADPNGQPWSDRKKYVWWDDAQKKWTGADVPDFAATKAPSTPAKPDGTGLDAHSGSDPFIMQTDGRAWLYAPAQLRDGPFPTHYEPAESPLQNPMYKQQTNPATKYFTDEPSNKLAQVADPNYPIVISTYRLTEHHLSGTMSRWLPWLAELQPELFIEMSPELALEKGINNLDWVVVETPRGQIEAKALVTRRMKPLRINGQILHEVGMPWHWGYKGVVRGSVTNDLTHMACEPNVTIHEGKVFTCNVRKGRLKA